MFVAKVAPVFPLPFFVGASALEIRKMLYEVPQVHLAKVMAKVPVAKVVAKVMAQVSVAKVKSET